MAASFHPTLSFSSGLPVHCTPTSAFLYKVSVYFGTCIPTPLGFVSTLLGNLSILSWLFAQMPQIYKNFQIKSAAGLSIFFLVEWLLGDLTNLLGALFTEQATWQVVLASYYVFVDICLVVQYFWYTHILPRMREGSIYSSGSDSSDDADSEIINALSPINSNFAGFEQAETTKDREEEVSSQPHTRPASTPWLSNVSHEKKALESFPREVVSAQWPGTRWSGPSPRTMMYAATLSSLATQAVAAPIETPDYAHLLQSKTPLQFAGTILSWCSTALYLGSRLPQLYKNWQRQSTAGLSPLLFFAAFCGNMFYSSSMLTNPNAWHNFEPYGGHGWADEEGSRRMIWIANAAPFFFGAFGVLFMDATMGVQFMMYGEQQDKLVKVRDQHGISRWQRVSGWMRGWIPTIRKEKVVDLAESQRLLSQSRELDRHLRHSQYGAVY